MRLLTFAMLAAVGATSGHATGRPRPPDVVRPNSNTARGGVLRDGVLTVTLEAKETLLYLDGPTRPAMTIAAFAEPGKAPLMPGPLLRVPAGTDLHVTIRNSLPTPLTFFVPAAVHGGPDQLAAMDSVVVASGGVGRLTARASVPGNYVYRAITPAGHNGLAELEGILAGALVIDTSRATLSPRDRVFVIMQTFDSLAAAVLDTVNLEKVSGFPSYGRGRFVSTINGRSWPNTERIHATVGDSLHWRIINADFVGHPVHLHGFYYRVDAFAGPVTDRFGRPSPGQMVVTQLMSGLSGMSMTWSPDRPGNWLFHCHFALHNTPDSLSAAPDDPYLREMVGLVLGTIVAERPGVVAAGEPEPVRQIRLVAEVDGPAGAAAHKIPLWRRERPDSVPVMHFVVEENGRRTDTHRDISPEIDLTRGEPVAITIVNHLAEPTSVHWHGIEVADSYVDGVPEFSGSGTHLTPAIAPGDSFIARFTPPRAGTFMYHAHVDELREEMAGLEGALIIREPGAPHAVEDHVFFYKGQGSHLHPLEINGQPNPDTVVLHVGRPARFRLLSLASGTVPSFTLTARSGSVQTPPADAELVRWQPVAKDGFDLLLAGRALAPARQVLGMGETYDFEYAPIERGTLHLEVWSNPLPLFPIRQSLLLSVPIRVEE